MVTGAFIASEPVERGYRSLLRNLELEQYEYERAFRDNAIDGEVLPKHQAQVHRSVDGAEPELVQFVSACDERVGCHSTTSRTRRFSGRGRRRAPSAFSLDETMASHDIGLTPPS